MTNLDRVQLLWKSQARSILPPVDRDVVIQKLTRTGKRFATDVVNLYCITGGFDGEMDDLGFSLWPIWRVEMQNTGSVHNDLAFADVLLDACWCYFRFETEFHSSVYGGYDCRRLANSIDEFFRLYLADPVKLDLSCA